MIDSLESTLLFASIAHKDQHMFSPDVPYISHCFAVAINVIEAYYVGKEEFDLDFALKIALLHDTIEDTSITYDELVKEYGQKIADGVIALSKNPSLPIEEQMADCIKRIQKCPKEVAIVKLADRTFNLRDRPEQWDPEKCLFYCTEGKMIMNELGYASKYLRHKLKQRVKNYLPK